jgi:hypothetical protein
MLEIGLFHNGASSLPVTTNKDGVTFNKGSLPEVHRVAQETLVNQVRQGILVQKLGFQSFWLTEHHFPCNRLTQQGLTYIGGVEIECHILKISDPRNGRHRQLVGSGQPYSGGREDVPRIPATQCCRFPPRCGIFGSWKLCAQRQ